MGLTFEEAVKGREYRDYAAFEFKRHEKVGFGTPTGKVELC